MTRPGKPSGDKAQFGRRATEAMDQEKADRPARKRFAVVCNGHGHRARFQQSMRSGVRQTGARSRAETTMTSRSQVRHGSTKAGNCRSISIVDSSSTMAAGVALSTSTSWAMHSRAVRRPCWRWHSRSRQVRAPKRSNHSVGWIGWRDGAIEIDIDASQHSDPLNANPLNARPMRVLCSAVRPATEGTYAAWRWRKEV